MAWVAWVAWRMAWPTTGVFFDTKKHDIQTTFMPWLANTTMECYHSHAALLLQLILPSIARY
jgi:hypothetical protein